ncbi:MAG: hypothetical protein WCI27_10445, partial [Candidatus Omnitrophota bacterium]
ILFFYPRFTSNHNIRLYLPFGCKSLGKNVTAEPTNFALPKRAKTAHSRWYLRPKCLFCVIFNEILRTKRCTCLKINERT